MVGLLSLLCIPGVLANPVVIESYPILTLLWIITLTFIFSLNLAVELIIIKTFLRKNILNSFKLYKTVLVVNLLTFPFTQIIAFLIFKELPPLLSIFLFYYVLVELIPISLECLFFIHFYKGMSELDYFHSPVKIKTTIFSTIVANLTTFIIGAIIFIPNYILAGLFV